MVLLPSKTDRDNLGINTLERGIVYSAFLLSRAVLNSDGPFKNSIRIGSSISNPVNDQVDYQAYLAIQADLPYERDLFLNTSGKKTDAVQVVSLDPPLTTLPAITPKTDPVYPMPSDPPGITTVEQYFIWVCEELAAAINPKDTAIISVNFFESNPDYPRFSINVRLPFDHTQYVSSGNYMSSLFAPGIGFPTDPNAGNGGTTATDWDQNADGFLDYSKGGLGQDVSAMSGILSAVGTTVVGIDADKIPLNFSPNEYTPTMTGTIAENIGQLAAHLKGIDLAIAQAMQSVDGGDALTLGGESPSYYLDLGNHIQGAIEQSQVNGLTTLLQSLAPLASPNFTGTPVAPEPSQAQGLATKNYVDTAIGNIQLPIATGGGIEPDGLSGTILEINDPGGASMVASFNLASYIADGYKRFAIVCSDVSDSPLAGNPLTIVLNDDETVTNYFGYIKETKIANSQPTVAELTSPVVAEFIDPVLGPHQAIIHITAIESGRNTAVESKQIILGNSSTGASEVATFEYYLVWQNASAVSSVKLTATGNLPGTYTLIGYKEPELATPSQSNKYIQTVVAGSGVSVLTISNIPSNLVVPRLTYSGYIDAAGDSDIELIINNDEDNNNYHRSGFYNRGSTLATAGNFYSNNLIAGVSNFSNYPAITGFQGALHGYETSGVYPALLLEMFLAYNSTTPQQTRYIYYWQNSTDAVTSIKVKAPTGSFAAGSFLRIEADYFD